MMAARPDRLGLQLLSACCLRRSSHLQRIPNRQQRGITNAPKGRGTLAVKPPQRPEKSIRVQSMEQVEIGNDMGMLPDQFIPPRLVPFLASLLRPRRHAVPSSSSSHRRPFTHLLLIPYLTIKSRILGLFSLLVYKSFTKPRPIIRMRQTGPVAVALHRQIYTAFAEADLNTLRTICTSGLRDDFCARIFTRPKDERWVWDIVRYNGGVKVVSNRAASLDKEGYAIRQAVVRIASRQVLTRYRPDGTAVAGSGKEKDVVEYLVLQKMMIKGKEGPWMVWGTTGETDIGEMKQEQRERRMREKGLAS